MANALVYLSILLVIGIVASVTYNPRAVSSKTNRANSSLQEVADINRPSVDQLAVASLAASTAEIAGLSVANDASSVSITMNVKSELALQDEAVITKPQVFEPTSSSAIITHKVEAGETVQTIAERFGVTSQTIKWANGLVTDALIAGSDLLVPSVDGAVVTVKDGDTVEALAEKYQSDSARIVSKNDLELSGLVVGQRIVLPGGVLPERERPGYIAPVLINNNTTTTYARSNPAYAAQAGNRYSYGYCTWYAYNRRVQLGRPIGSFWGNASSWAYMAGMSGYGVSRSPDIGDIMQNGGGAGHVAVVEEKRPDGSIVVSEMNYYGTGGGWNVISYRTLDAGQAAGYNFIK